MRDNGMGEQIGLWHQRGAGNVIAEDFDGLLARRPQHIFLDVADAAFAEQQVGELMQHREGSAVRLHLAIDGDHRQRLQGKREAEHLRFVDGRDLENQNADGFDFLPPIVVTDARVAPLLLLVGGDVQELADADADLLGIVASADGSAARKLRKFLLKLFGKVESKRAASVSKSNFVAQRRGIGLCAVGWQSALKSCGISGSFIGRGRKKSLIGRLKARASLRSWGMDGRSPPCSQASILWGWLWMRRAVSSTDNPAAERNHCRTAGSISAFGDCVIPWVYCCAP